MTQVFKTREHESVSLPGELVYLQGRLNIFPDLKGEKLFKVALRETGIELQAAGYIGFIPLNNDVALEIEPRIPVANVEYLLARSGLTPAITLPFVRQFDAARENAEPFLQLLAMRFDALLQELRYEGVYKTYARHRQVGSDPSGRIFQIETALRSRATGRATAVFERFERTINNSANRLIRAAGRKLLQSAIFGNGSINPKLSQSIRNGLSPFREVTDITNLEILKLESMPANRPVLGQLVAISGVVLRDLGVRLRGEGQLRLPTFLIKMDDVFEAYIRKALMENRELAGLEIQDGNHKPPSGAAKQLFEEVGALGNRDVTPDIVVSREGRFVSVIEVKYKPCPKQPERDNLNQLLTYALTYGVKHAVLMYPAKDNQATELTNLGSVRGVKCYKATIDLSVEDLGAEEKVLSSLLLESFLAT